VSISYKHINDNFPLAIRLSSFHSHNNNYKSYPNPVNSISQIKYSLPFGGNVKLFLTNTLGQTLKSYESEYKEKGIYNLSIDLNSHSSGIYFLNIQFNNFQIKSTKVVLIK